MLYFNSLVDKMGSGSFPIEFKSRFETKLRPSYLSVNNDFILTNDQKTVT
jgi:hypothetical protein